MILKKVYIKIKKKINTNNLGYLFIIFYGNRKNTLFSEKNIRK